ncbi:MAG: preprotein translocase subunit SecG [Methylococcaceae bacterium]|nr:preprotein translocase subunit SecG [Methylococcaceae bacterium]
MYQVLVVIHVVIALSIIGLVLLQQGRGADAGAGFGGGASGTLFGARGAASFLSRTTAICATLFFTTSMLLAYLGGRQDNKPHDIMEVQQQAPAQSKQDLPVAPEVQGDSAKPESQDKADLPAPAE